MTEGFMVFVDGENLAIRGKIVAQAASVSLVPGPYYYPDTFLWPPEVFAENLCDYHHNFGPHIGGTARRSFYYTAVQGDAVKVGQVGQQLKDLGFMPRVFKKVSGVRSKRVDITLATEALSNAHFGNYDAAVLISGDADFVPLVDEIQRMGKIVVVAFFKGKGAGLSNELVLSADRFVPLDDLILSRWRWFTGTPEPEEQNPEAGL